MLMYEMCFSKYGSSLKYSSFARNLLENHDMSSKIIYLFDMSSKIIYLFVKKLCLQTYYFKCYTCFTYFLLLHISK